MAYEENGGEGRKLKTAKSHPAAIGFRQSHENEIRQPVPKSGEETRRRNLKASKKMQWKSAKRKS